MKPEPLSLSENETIFLLSYTSEILYDLHFPYILIKHHGTRSPGCYGHIIFTLIHNTALPPVIGALFVTSGGLSVGGILVRALLPVTARSVTGQNKAIRGIH